MNRTDFIKSLLGASVLGALPNAYTISSSDIPNIIKETKKKTTGSMYGFKVAPISKVRIGLIGVGNRGKTLLEMLSWMVQQETAEITAIADLLDANIAKGLERIKTFQKKSPKTYGKTEEDWKNMLKEQDLDLVIICTPWRHHTPMSIYAMEQGIHVACEVPISYTLSDCWDIVQTAERTQRHCMMLENCCYNEEELFVLNMVERGVFGDITHAEGAYLHDLRAHLLSEDYYQGQWRIKQHVDRDGNFYTTHGLGPISFYMGIGRGDTFTHLTSMSSREKNLSETAKQKGSPYTEIACGDMNTTLIKTSLGKTIMLQFDVHTGRPYSRINKLVGTKAVHDGYPSRLYVDKKELAYWGHQWLTKEEYQSYKSKYKHPMISKLSEISKQFKQGHGGMDFVMLYRLITCLNLGLPLDKNVYDGVLWSAITPLSELSVRSNSLSLPIPDFTNGLWKKKQDLEIMRQF